MRGSLLRRFAASLLAVFAALWFEIDFSRSHRAVSDAVSAAAALPQRSLPPFATLGEAFGGGIVTALPPWGVLAVAAFYLLGRMTLKYREVRR